MRNHLLTNGFRPFFLLVGLWAVIALGAWIAMLEGGSALPSRFAPMDWHIHEMIFGLVMAAITGFLLTAIPNWTSRLPVSGGPLALLAALWLAGRLAVMFSAFLSPFAASAIDLSFTGAVMFVAGREIVAGRNWKHVTVLVPLSLMFAGNLLMHLGQTGTGWRLAMAAITFMVALIGGRIVPSFTRNRLKKEGIAEPQPTPGPLVAGSLLSLSAGMIGWAFAASPRGFGLLLLFSAGLHAIMLAQWKGAATWREPLLLILHVGYGWLVFGLLLLGLSLFDLGIPESAAVHALTAGAFAVMILAVMTRASLGHTGRALHANRLTIWLYAFANLAALLRVGAALSPEFSTLLIRLSALFWINAFLLFVADYAPILWAPRFSGNKE
jgi:uncharacterized protein involved in response to NO